MSRGVEGLFRAMSDSLYKPKVHVPDHLLDAARRPMNGQEAARLVARVVDPKDMFK